jgi:hypothetical protein
VNRIIRRSSAPVALLLLALALVAPVSAAEPETIVYDVTVAVRFVDADAAGTPLAGATVGLEARLTDFPEDPALASLHATTDADGFAVFTGVPRGAPGAPAVHLTIEAQAETRTIDTSLCLTTTTWAGSVTDVASPPDAPIVVVANSGASSIACRWLSGRILDRRGNPVPANAAIGQITIALPDGGEKMELPLKLGADGSFRQPLPAWGSPEAPAVVTLQYVGPSRSLTRGGCVESVAESVTWQEPLALEGQDAPVLELVSATVGGGTCGAVSTTPAPQAAMTLPPTDVPGAGESDSVAGSAALVVAGLLALSGLLVGIAAGRRRHA